MEKVRVRKGRSSTEGQAEKINQGKGQAGKVKYGRSSREDQPGKRSGRKQEGSCG